MKESLWAYLIIFLGVLIFSIMLIVQRINTTTEEDFYLGREIMEASMIDAIDYGNYRLTGEITIIKQKFVEVFLRRFAESVTNNKTYQIDFFDIYENPPKASVRIRTKSESTIVDSSDINLDTLLNGIIETTHKQSCSDCEPDNQN